MKKIIKRGAKKPPQKKPTKFYRVTCPKCDTLIEYDNIELEKVKGTKIGGIMCPKKKCSQFIPHFEDYRIPMEYEAAKTIMEAMDTKYSDSGYLMNHHPTITQHVLEMKAEIETEDEIKATIIVENPSPLYYCDQLIKDS